MPALTVSADARQEGLQSVDDSAEIHRQPEIPVRVGDALERSLDADSGVVHDHVHLAEHAFGLVRCGRQGAAIGNVHPNCMNAL